MAQGVTTGSIAGIVKDAQGLAVPGSTVLAVHQPSGIDLRGRDARGRPVLRFPACASAGRTRSRRRSRASSRRSRSDVFVNLGVATDLTLTLKTLAVAEDGHRRGAVRRGVQLGAHGRGDGHLARDAGVAADACRQPAQRLHAPDAAGRAAALVRRRRTTG
ncbi:MAG: hypothetical protein MZV64_72745 [Ignavibacteriales bacterium]|nr:hypothetical protein [Ignavibacteriales bacterium]